MNFKELVKKNRSYRRFYQDHEIDEETLTGLIDTARHTASGANRQPLKYIISCSKEKNRKILSCLKWAGYLTDWDGPEEGEKPSGYIVILEDKNIGMASDADHGIAAQTILLDAVEKGLGGCILAAIDKPKLKSELCIEDRYEVLLVIALGKPKENVVIEEVRHDDIKYYRDSSGTHHVPKRGTDELIINIKGE